jgi:hypothetical protein
VSADSTQFRAITVAPETPDAAAAAAAAAAVADSEARKPTVSPDIAGNAAHGSPALGRAGGSPATRIGSPVPQLSEDRLQAIWNELRQVRRVRRGPWCVV